MIDKTKVLKLSVISLGAIVAIVFLIIWMSTPTSKNKASENPTPAPTVTASPTNIPGSEATEGAYEEVLSFTPALAEKASEAAAAASAWSKSAPDTNRINSYTRAHITAEVAAAFTPVWAEIFTTAKTAEITTEVRGNPAVNQVTGAPGNRTFTVGVSVMYRGTWLNKNGLTGYQQPAIATWWLTVDEATEEITEITQPTPNDLQIRLANQEATR